MHFMSVKFRYESFPEVQMWACCRLYLPTNRCLASFASSNGDIRKYQKCVSGRQFSTFTRTKKTILGNFSPREATINRKQDVATLETAHNFEKTQWTSHSPDQTHFKREFVLTAMNPMCACDVTLNNNNGSTTEALDRAVHVCVAVKSHYEWWWAELE